MSNLISRRAFSAIAAASTRRPQIIAARVSALSIRHSSTDHGHSDETYEDFTTRYVNFFDNDADDMFELSRGLNNAFCTDLVPAPEVLVAAMKAARRLNSFSVAARVVEALREKLNGDEKIFNEYLADLQPTMTELGIPTPTDLGR